MVYECDWNFMLDEVRIPARDPGVVCATVCCCFPDLADKLFKEIVLEPEVLLIESPVDDSFYVELQADGVAHATLMIECFLGRIKDIN